MAVVNATFAKHTFSVTMGTREVPCTATFNGRVYNGKRYINTQYRLNSTKTGLKQATSIWEDGFGWVECAFAGDTLVELFGLE
jgi:hypothetical protein